MAHVVIAGSNGREFTGGLSEFDVGATTVRRLILELDDRYPGFGDYIERRMAIAIDGEIHQDSYGAELGPDSEVYLIPKIGGG
ncbi:MAG: MoaD/ThiS family protein [Caulobacteraceae bacterium]|nr:MoaD/ThiS family protein [Caulobacteraceae bacterium]